MKKCLLILFVLSVLIACDDGDVITTSFDFPETNLQVCGSTNNYLFYKLNDAGTESISVFMQVSEDVFTSSDTTVVNFSASGSFANYRVYNSMVENSYFCNEIPPTTPEVLSEYLATAGSATLYTFAILADSDGLDEDQEANGDTDGDGLEDYFDFDDDGDNVPTILELDTENADGDNDPTTNPKDTDDDGIADYLDPDDDGDGILTRDEDADGDLDPTNDITDPEVGADYLNDQVSNKNLVEEYREHEYGITTDIELFLEDFIFINGEEQINRAFLSMGEITSFLTGTILLKPVFVID